MAHDRCDLLLCDWLGVLEHSVPFIWLRLSVLRDSEGIAMFALLLCLALLSPSSNIATETVDLIELNHFHDCNGRHVYDQVIFYEWSEPLHEYHVRAWCLIEDREPENRRPTRSYSDDSHSVRWFDRDQQLHRTIRSQHFRESWTQVDPERANKKLLDERDRKSLIRRTLPAPPTTSPSSLPQVVPDATP